MNERTDTVAAGEALAQQKPARWCHWHRAMSDTAELVRMFPSMSGTNTPELYACTPCRDTFGLRSLDGMDAAQLLDAIRTGGLPMPTPPADTYNALRRHRKFCPHCTANHRCPVGKQLWATWDAENRARAGS